MLKKIFGLISIGYTSAFNKTDAATGNAVQPPATWMISYGDFDHHPLNDNWYVSNIKMCCKSDAGFGSIKITTKNDVTKSTHDYGYDGSNWVPVKCWSRPRSYCEKTCHDCEEMRILGPKFCIKSAEVNDSLSKFTFTTTLGRSVNFGGDLGTNSTRFDFPNSCMSGVFGRSDSSKRWLGFYYTDKKALPVDKTVYPTYKLIKEKVGCNHAKELGPWLDIKDCALVVEREIADPTSVCHANGGGFFSFGHWKQNDNPSYDCLCCKDKDDATTFLWNTTVLNIYRLDGFAEDQEEYGELQFLN